MTHSLRLQRSRKKGYRTPEGTIYVGRPTIWGNPFQAKKFGHTKSVNLHRRWINGNIGALILGRLGFTSEEIDSLTRWRARLLPRLHELVDKPLQCWCSTKAPCHADTLMKTAKQSVEYERCVL